MKAAAVTSGHKSGIFATVVEPTAAGPETWTDVVLVDAMVAGSAQGWREFQRRYERLVHRCILKVTRRFSSILSQDDVHEIAAMLYLSLLANDMHKLRAFDPGRGNRFSSWIGLLAINCAYDTLRQRRREPNKAGLAEAADLASPLPDPFDTVTDHERANLAHHMLESFTERDRMFTTLYFGEGMQPHAIARHMNVSVKTVYSKKHKIRSRLEAIVRAA